jgi:hypothetical protein
MSKQLTLSATFAVFASAMFALAQGPAAPAFEGPLQSGTPIEIAAPVLPEVPELPALPSLTR